MTSSYKPFPGRFSTAGRRKSSTVTATAACVVLSLCVASFTGVAFAADPPALQGEQQQLSYALGMAYGNQLRKQSPDVDAAVLNRGLNDALSGTTTLLTEGEARALIVSFQEVLKKKQLAAQAEKLQAENELAEANRRIGEAFLATNKSNQGVITLASGLQYKILKAGDGKKPTLDDTIVCHYRGSTIDGTEFDSTYSQGKPATMPIKGVIKGWSEALQHMTVGSKWQLFVPSQLAYGARAAGRSFGPNSTLVFQLELLSIENKDKASAQQRLPSSAAVAGTVK